MSVTKRIVILLLCSLILLSNFNVVKAEEDVITGSCGWSNVTYSLNRTQGILTISGSGAIYDYSYEREVPWYSYKTIIEKVVIDDGITYIGKRNFFNCTNLTSIEIPDSITRIGDYVFCGCTNLTSIEIPNNVTYIGQSTFNGCRSLSSIEIPDSVTSIEDDTFDNCTNLIFIKIPTSVTRIGGMAFSDCTNLASIEIPDSVTSIGQAAFQHCFNLTSIKIPNNVTNIGDGTFNGCISLSSIEIPDSVTSIGDYAFSNCTNLASIEIPDSVTSIGQAAFSGCESLTSVVIPDSVTIVGWCAFHDCTNLTSIEIPNSVTGIGSNAFLNVPVVTVYCDNTLITSSNKYGAISVRTHHHVTNGEKEEPTCISEGCITGTCSVCGEANVKQYLPYLNNHEWLSEIEYTWLDDYKIVKAQKVCSFNPKHTSCELSKSSINILVAPTCTESGLYQYIATFKDSDFAPRIEVVDANPLGHDYEAVLWNWDGYQNATVDLVCKNDNTHTLHEEANITSEITTAPCETTGIRTYTASVTVNGVTYTDTKEEELEAIGHDYQFDRFEWNGDKASAVYVCNRDADHVVYYDAEVTSKVITEPTCAETGIKRYTATYDGHTETKEETLPMIPHDWGTPAYEWSEDYSTVTGTVICNYDNTHVITEAVNTKETRYKNPTCETAGTYIYTAVFSDEHLSTQTKMVTIPALGHDWGAPEYEWSEDNSSVTASVICNNDSSHVIAETVNTTVEYGATCEEGGANTYTAIFENDLFETQSRIIEEGPRGHYYHVDEWNWNGYDSAVANLVCDHDNSHTETVEGIITCEIINPTCEEAGTTVYTVTAEYNDQTFTDTKIVEYPASGHDWGEVTYIWAVDNSSVTATRICQNDTTHIETETVNTTSIISKPATCYEVGKMTYTASFTNSAFETQTKTVDISATGHTWIYDSFVWNNNESAVAKYICQNDESHVWYITAQITSVTTAASCESDGKTVYTATIVETDSPDGNEHTDSLTVIIPATGHTEGEVVKENEVLPTCEREGSYDLVVYCTECGEELSREHITVEALGHNWGEWTVTKEPTCTEAGEETRVCANDSSHKETRPIDALGHDWDNPVYTWFDNNESCEASRICKRDRSHYENEGATVTITVIEATCTEKGQKTYTATFTNTAFETQTKTVEIPALGHTAGEAVKENEVLPSCETEGSYDMVVYCTVCGEELSREHHVVAALGHDWGEWVYDGSEFKTHTHTCTHDGTHTETENCVFDNGVVSGNIKTYTCQVCGGTYTEELPADRVIIQSSALVLEGVIQIQFKVIVPEAEEKNIVIKFEGEDESKSYEKSYDAIEKRTKIEETADGTLYYYRVPVYAKQMNDKVTIWFTDKEGNRVSFYRGSGADVTETGFEYSVATYINNMWNSSKEKTRNLVRAMKYYGLYAQKAFTYEVSLADEILSTLDPMQDVDVSLLEEYAYRKEGEAPAGLKVASFSLTLTDDVRINYKLEVGEGVNPKNYVIKLDGKKVSAKKSGDEWYVYKTNIAAKDLDTMHELSISDGTKTIVYRYGVLTYCYNKLSNSETNTKTKNLCKAIYWYSKAADAYWGS